MQRRTFWAVLSVVALLVAFSATAQMGKPKVVTLSGKVMDLTCASKGKVMMDSWTNAENDEHKTPDGPKPGCATMCLKGGQPAALFSDGKIEAIFGCNPRETLANYAAKNVEVKGFWAGGKKDNIFIPQQIAAAGSTDWEEVNCATMH